MHWLDKDGAICIQWPEQPRRWLPWNSDCQGKISTGLAADSCYNLQPLKAQFLIVFYFMNLTSLLSTFLWHWSWYSCISIAHFVCKFACKGQNLIPFDQLAWSIHLFQFSQEGFYNEEKNWFYLCHVSKLFRHVVSIINRRTYRFCIFLKIH